MIDRVAETSPRLKARFAGTFYVITILTGAYGLFAAHTNPWAHVANLVAGAAYLVVAVLLYDLLKPVNENLSMLAVFFSIVGVANGNDGFFFFGVYCLLLGFLIFRSSFLPRVIGLPMALAGVALLTSSVTTLLSPELAHSLSNATAALDGLGEISLTLWLLVFGVNAQRWQQRASTSAELQSAQFTVAR